MPEQIWILEDEETDSNHKLKKSTMPVLNPQLTLSDPRAIPGFFVPMLSMAHGKADPVISMATDSKFFLLLDLCARALKGNLGKLVYVDGDSDGEKGGGGRRVRAWEGCEEAMGQGPRGVS